MKIISTKKYLQKIVSSLFIVALMMTALGEMSVTTVHAASGGPPNDDFDSAVDITSNISSYPYSYSILEGTTAATVASDDPFIATCNENFGASTVWFKFTAPNSGLITIDTTNSDSGYDSIVALWTGTRGRGNLNLVGCNDDAPGATNTVRAKMSAWVTKNVVYYVEIVNNYGDYISNPTPAQLQNLLGAISGGALALTVSLSSVQPFGSGTYDDTNPTLKYSGYWVSYNGAGPFANTLTYSIDPLNGNSVNYVFNGTQFYVMYTQNTNRGIFDVYVDGSKIASVNENGILSWQKIWASPVLTAGIHYVTLVHASGNFFDIDSITAGSPTEFPAKPPAIISDLTAATGSAPGTVNLTFTAPGDDYVSPGPATGTATSYYIRYSSSAITAANWASATPYTASVLVPAAAGTPQTLIVSGLNPGTTYYFAVIAVDEKGNYPSVSGVVGISNSPSAMAQTPQPLGAGTYDDNNVAWNYVGAWVAYDATGPYNNTLHYSGNLGDYTEVQIDGQQFIITYTGNPNRGEVEVYVDGNPIPFDSFTEYDNALTWQKTYQSPPFSAGIHTVRFTHKSGTYVDIDAITILDAPDTTAPAAVTNLSATTTDLCKTCLTPIGAVNLSWAAPGSDGWFGKALSYEVRYSLSPITDQGSWDSATAVATGIPSPAVAGTTQSMTITGLFPTTIYYYAIRAWDNSNNFGDVSNSPFAKPKSPTPVGAGVYDDTYAAWIYGGSGWQMFNGAGPYNNTLHYSGSVDDFAQITFTGPQFTVFYTANANRGIYDVYVDSVKIDSFDANSGSLLWQQQYTSPILDVGVHTVRFVHASGGIVDIDVIRIPSVVGTGIHDDTNAAWIYGGSGWQMFNGAGPYNNTLHYSGSVDDFAQITFTGPQFTVFYTANANRGIYDVYVDDVKIDSFDANSGSLLWQQQYTSPILDMGAHTVRFVHASGGIVDIDAIRIASAVGAGIHDDTNAAWIYSGAWTAYTGTGPYNNTIHYSSNLGDYAEILITSSQFTLTYTGNPNRGNVDVYVDNVKVDTLNEFNSSLSWQSPYTYSSLSPAIHQVRFVHASGTFIDIDAIKVEPIPLTPGTYDDSYGTWVYAGNWAAYTGAGPYNNTIRYSSNIGDYVDLTFNGSQFRLLYTGNANRGIVAVYIDGVMVASLNEYNSPLVWQMTYVSPPLSSGLHSVRIVHVTGVYIDIDAITILP